MANGIEYNKTPDQESFILRSKEMDLEAGLLGKCFGSSANAPLNIAGLFVVLLVGSGITVLFVNSAIPAVDYWTVIAPLLALVVGYIFGKGSKQ